MHKNLPHLNRSFRQFVLVALAVSSVFLLTPGVTGRVQADGVPAGTIRLWSDSDTPALIDANDTTAIEVGLKFYADVPGKVVGLKFYKSASNTGVHTGHLWKLDGTELASVTFTGETTSGWQQALFDTPVALDANTPYVISYYAPNSHYSATVNYFQSGHDNGVLHAYQDGGAVGPNGLFIYSNDSQFPTSDFEASNYWVDPLFLPDDTTNPTISLTAPANGATVRGSSVAIAADASDDRALEGVQFNLTNDSTLATIALGAEDTTNPYGVTWDTTQVADGSYTISAVATDAAGNQSTAASTTVTVDNTAPTTTISGGPSASTTDTTATFLFTSNEAGSSFSCQLDGGIFTSCSSPQSYSGLSVGSHTLHIRATDTTGNVEATPASYTWTVTAPATLPITDNNTPPTTTTSTTTHSAATPVTTPTVPQVVETTPASTTSTAPKPAAALPEVRIQESAAPKTTQPANVFIYIIPSVVIILLAGWWAILGRRRH